MTEEEQWRFTIDVPVYDEEGRAYEYAVVEREVKGYQSRVSEEDGFFTITNRYLEKTEDPEKPGDDPQDEDGSLLPKTATPYYNILVIGFVLFVIGFTTLLYSRRKLQ